MTRLLDPEDNGEGVTGFADFMKFLAPAGPGGPPLTARKEELFSDDWVRQLPYPHDDDRPQHSRRAGQKTVNLYSDLLLHDIGTDDGIVQGLAQGNEFRTAPLWGLSRRDRFMHDAKSNTIEDAILRHGGEAPTAREKFEELSPADRAALLAFLNSL